MTFVGADYLGIAFDDGCEALIRRAALEQLPAAGAECENQNRGELPWPDSTFAREAEDAQHFPGSHWDPFVEDTKEIMARLPEIVPRALLQTGYGEFRKPHRAEPDEWPKGFQLVWPLRVRGLALILRPEKERNLIVSLFPFFATGSQQTLTLLEVTVWTGGLEAQISARWGEGEVTFFDTRYVINRAWYETGRDYDVILSGVAYAAEPVGKREWTIDRHPDEVDWLNLRGKDGEELHGPSRTLTLDGAAMLLPLGGWDADDYCFHAPVKTVEEFKDWLGQDGWRVRATVMRFGDGDADLDILITRRAWSSEAPPLVGQDIEGRLWLQGYLWMPM